MEAFGWQPAVLAVDPAQVEGFTDDLLLETLPEGLDVQYLQALNYRWTRHLGLGSVALRSLPFYLRAGNQMLSTGAFDLVYFSTTMFPVLALGPYWKRRYGTPFVVDMQDPWHSDYYLHRPKSERPPKYWFAYRLNGFLEPRVLPESDGLIAVTASYIDELCSRYPALAQVPSAEIPFGASEADMAVARSLPRSARPDGEIIGTYTGVCNSAMLPALEVMLAAFRRGIDEQPRLFENVRLRFIGTNYAPAERAAPVVLPLARRHQLLDRVEEQTSRVPYFEALKMQAESDFLLLPGTLDRSYTASKLYPYIMSQRPILGLFSSESTVCDIVRKTRSGLIVAFDSVDVSDELVDQFLMEWTRILERLPFTPDTDWEAFEPYTAREMTRRQVEVFDRVIAKRLA